MGICHEVARQVVTTQFDQVVAWDPSRVKEDPMSGAQCPYGQGCSLQLRAGSRTAVGESDCLGTIRDVEDGVAANKGEEREESLMQSFSFTVNLSSELTGEPWDSRALFQPNTVDQVLDDAAPSMAAGISLHEN